MDACRPQVRRTTLGLDRAARSRVSAAVVLALATLWASVLPGVAAHAAGAAAVAVATKPANAWPEMHHDAGLSGTSPDPLLSTANAANLGVRWMANTGAQILGSPVVAWNPTLKKTLAYVANEAGYLMAFDESNGSQVWSVGFGQPIRTTPLVDGTFLWVAPTYSHRIYKLNASTGKAICSAPLTVNADSSPVLATPPGGVTTVYEGVNDIPGVNGPLTAVNEATCAIIFSVTPYPTIAGMWDPISYAIDATGEPLALFGTADPDSAVYALDARTGALVWRFAINNPLHTQDVGAGVTISSPGVNGFADGVAYVPGKDGYFYALDLTTGAVVWEYNFGADNGLVPPGTLSTPALTGNELVFGDNAGAYALNATTGTKLWRYFGGLAVLSSPAVVGPPGNQVAVFGDVGGVFHVVSAATGVELYQHQTGGFIVTSPADVDGNLLIASSDSFLYDFAPGAGKGPAPSTTVTSPVDGSTVSNPNGSLNVVGTAAGTTTSPVGAVNVAVQLNGISGPWWDGATGTWVSGPYENPATLTAPGSASTGWNFAFPVPASGDGYRVFASAVNGGGVSDVTAQQSPPTTSRISVTVLASTTAPQVHVGNTWATPGVSLNLSGTGFGAGEKVSVTLNGAVVGQGTASSTGALASVPVAIPRTAVFGPGTLLATGANSSRAGTAAIYVTNAWNQLASGSQRNSFESNDPGPGQHLTIDPSRFLTQAWSFNSGGAIRTSPAVVQDVAYFGNDTGTVFAVNVLNGLQLWTYQADSAPLLSSPLVDSGMVIVGTQSGTVQAVNAASGVLMWSTPVGSAVTSSPTASSSRVFVTTSAGHVVALNEVTGKQTWSATLGGTSASSPSVDPISGLLFVGDNTGAVTALHVAAGTVDWTSHTGGAVTAAPAVNSNRVYVGSATGTLYAFNEASGSTLWTYAAGSAITTGVSVGASILSVGTTAGFVAFVNPGTGAQVLRFNLQSPVVGLAQAPDFVVAETASGEYAGIKPSGQNIQWLNTAPGPLASSPAINDGTVYMTGVDGVLRTFTVAGQPVL